MKCPKCGSDNVDGAKFCASCGAQLSKKPDEKIPIYLRVWCGILMTIALTAITSSMWCLLLFPLLFAARLSEYPNRRKGAWLELVVTLCICGGLGYAIYYFENANQRTLDKYIQSGNYEEALAFVDEHFKTSDYAYYKAKADIFEASGDFDKAAEIVLRYCEQSDDLTSLNADAEKRLVRYQEESVSSDTSLAIDAFHAQVISAKQEAEEEVRIQQEAREAEERAAREADATRKGGLFSSVGNTAVNLLTGGSPQTFRIGSQTWELGGVTLDDIRDSYTVTEQEDNAVVIETGKGVVAFEADDDGVITRVGIRAPDVECYKGVKSGQAEKEVYKKLGAADSANSYYSMWLYDSNGKRMGWDDITDYTLKHGVSPECYTISVYFDGGKVKAIELNGIASMPMED